MKSIIQMTGGDKMQEGRVDLHLHSTFSDGTDTPKEIVDMANSLGLSAIALTDHDTVNGVSYALEAAEGTGLEVISGVELSTFFRQGEIHIVGLFVDHTNKQFIFELEKMRILREERNRLMCKRLREMDVDVHYSNLIETYKSHTITRSIFADFLYRNGYVKTRKDAYVKYIGSNCHAYVQRTGISPEQGIDLIYSAGGLPILAHPFAYNLSEDELSVLIKNLKEHGLQGIEAFYTTHTDEETNKVRECAKKYNLALSGGSDYHGKNKPLISLGTGYGELRINSSLLDSLKERHESLKLNK